MSLKIGFIGDSISNNYSYYLEMGLTTGSWQCWRAIETPSTYPSGPEMADSTFWNTHVTAKNFDVLFVNFGLHDALVTDKADQGDYESASYFVKYSEEVTACNTILGYIAASSSIKLAGWITTTECNEDVVWTPEPQAYYIKNDDTLYYSNGMSALFTAAGWPTIDLRSYVAGTSLAAPGADGIHYDAQDAAHMGSWLARQIEQCIKNAGLGRS